jgi:dihydroorotase
MATRINGCTKVVFNKMDVLEGLDAWCLYDGPNLYQFKKRDDIELWLSGKLELEVDDEIEVMFSGDKEFI